MSISLIRGSLSALKWALCAVGAVALLITALVATPLVHPPELVSISAARATVDFSALPAVERFQARDGTMLGYRHYPAIGPSTGRAAVVVHGSSGSSGSTIHALSMALAARGVETWATDTRGHGASGTRGDIGYVGQLEDDLAEFVADVRKTAPTVKKRPRSRPRTSGWRATPASKEYRKDERDKLEKLLGTGDASGQPQRRAPRPPKPSE